MTEFPSDLHPDERTKYVLITDNKVFGPFEDATEAEYAAMAYWGTAVTGASARDDIKILPVLGKPMPLGYR